MARRNPSAISATRPDEGPEAPDENNFWVFDSSRVQEAAYDQEHQRLYVRFVKPVDRGGTPWTYEGVPPNVWRNFRRSQSPGKFIHRVLNQYDYHHGAWD
jgi:hypothetical protein